MSSPRFSVIIPVFNEAARIEASLQELEQFAAGLEQEWELLFVDDGSRDKTVELLQQWQSSLPHRIIKLPKNQGKGWAVRKGMLEAQGDFRAFLDADMATPPSELHTLFAALIEGADVAIGSRIQADGTDLRLVGRKPQPWIRRFLGKAFRLVATRPFLGRIRDSQCGAKAFTAQAAEALFSRQQIKRWTFDIEILYLAKKAKLKVVEVPVLWEAKDNSKLQPSLSLAIDTMKELGRLWWIHRAD